MEGRGATSVHPHASSWALSLRQYLKHSTKSCRKSEQNPSIYTGYMMLGRVTWGNSLQLLLTWLHVHCVTQEAVSPIRDCTCGAPHARQWDTGCWDMDLGCWDTDLGCWAATGLSGKELGPQHPTREGAAAVLRLLCRGAQVCLELPAPTHFVADLSPNRAWQKLQGSQVFWPLEFIFISDCSKCVFNPVHAAIQAEEII